MTMTITAENRKGKTYRINTGKLEGQKYFVLGLWIDIHGKSWMETSGNPPCINYAIRSAESDLPIDDNVYYGKIDGMGYLVHESELGEEVKQ